MNVACMFIFMCVYKSIFCVVLVFAFCDTFSPNEIHNFGEIFQSANIDVCRNKQDVHTQTNMRTSEEALSCV